MSRPKQPISDKQMREIVALGKKHAETAFPNPKRIACPDSATLRAMAYRDKRLSPVELPVSHVATCSPCFREYTHHRRNAKLVRTFQVTVGSLAVVGILLTAAFLVRKYVGQSELPSVSQQPSIKQSPPRPTAPPPVLPIAVKIDLAPLSPTRSDTSRIPANKVTLPAKLLRATFLMPIGFEPGEYSVRLSKPNSEALLDTRTLASMKDGVTSFEVELNLETVSQSRLTLMIRPPGLGWRTFPVFVE